MKVIVNPKYEKAKTLILNLTKDFVTSGITIYKGRNTIKYFQTEYGDWMIKHYKRPFLFQRIVYTFFRKSKAERAYLYASKLLALGIQTPEGIAYVEDKKWGLIRDCYFISYKCNYTTIHSILTKTNNYDHKLISELATFFIKLHKKGILHGDLNLNNILYYIDTQDHIHFSVIDTNRSTFKPSLTKEECLNNLKRVTHRRDLLQDIIKEYAVLRNWDQSESVRKIMKILNKFEKRRKMNTILKLFKFKTFKTTR